MGTDLGTIVIVDDPGYSSPGGETRGGQGHTGGGGGTRGGDSGRSPPRSPPPPPPSGAPSLPPPPSPAPQPSLGEIVVSAPTTTVPLGASLLLGTVGAVPRPAPAPKRRAPARRTKPNPTRTRPRRPQSPPKPSPRFTPAPQLAPGQGLLARLGTALSRFASRLFGPASLLLYSPPAGPDDEYPLMVAAIEEREREREARRPAPGSLGDIVITGRREPTFAPLLAPTLAAPLGTFGRAPRSDERPAPVRIPSAVPSPALLPLPGIGPNAVPAPGPVATPAPGGLTRVRPFPLQSPGPVSTPRPQPRQDPRRKPLARPLPAPLPAPLPSPLSPLSPIGSPVSPILTGLQPQAVPSPGAEANPCKCPKQSKPKRKKRQPRTKCFRGTYQELRSGLIKHRKEEIPCQ